MWKAIDLKLFLSLMVLTLFLTGGATSSQSQGPAPDETATRFTGQAPLTEVEVKKYLDTMSAVVKSGGDPAKMKAAVEEGGWEQLRFAFVNTRVNSAIEVIKSGEEAAQALRAGLRPTEEELALVKPYETQLETLNKQALDLINQRRPQSADNS